MDKVQINKLHNRHLVFMGQCPYWKANSCSASQEIPRLLWNPEVHYRVHNSLPMDTILSKMNPVHTLTSYFHKDHFNIIIPSTLRSPKWSVSYSVFRLKFYMQVRKHNFTFLCEWELSVGYNISTQSVHRDTNETWVWRTDSAFWLELIHR
jgi:hypothetical protein